MSSQLSKTKLPAMLFVAIVGAIFIAIFAQIRFEIPYSDGIVPITGQSFAVLVFALGAGAVAGAAGTFLYLLLGALGIGVFAGGTSGFHHLVGSTGGYLYGFVIAAYVTGWLAEKGWDQSYPKAFAAMSIGTVIILTLGYIHLWAVKGQTVASENGLHEILLQGALVKAIFGAMIWPTFYALNRRLEKK